MLRDVLQLGNLERVEEYESSERDSLEYNLWLAADCAGTEFQNANRTWFHFSVTIPPNFNKKVLRFVPVYLHVALRTWGEEGGRTV